METYPFNRRRLFAMLALIGIGVAVLICGVRLEIQNPRGERDDEIAWWVLAGGMFLIGAGVGSAFGRPLLAMLIGIAFLIFAWPLCVVLFWAGLLYGGFDYSEAARSGYPQIPEARQIDDLIGQTDHFVANSEGGLHYFTEAHFADRYELLMTVAVQVDKRTSQITSVAGQPTFCLYEVDRIELLPGGGTTVSYRGSAERKFGADEWRKVVEAKGDFSVIGIQLERTSPVPNFDKYVEQLPHRRFHP